MRASAACPCGRIDTKKRPATYADCCGRFVDHFDAAPAPDAEHLMRSRYSAFVRELIIPFGNAGYVALFEIEGATTVNILAVRHQLEDDYH